MTKPKSLQRPSPALVLSFLALLGVLGGVAYAAGLGKNSVGKKQIKADAVRSEEVKDSSLARGDLAASALPPGPVGAGVFRDPAVPIVSKDRAAPTTVAT